MIQTYRNRLKLKEKSLECKKCGKFTAHAKEDGVYFCVFCLTQHPKSEITSIKLPLTFINYLEYNSPKNRSYFLNKLLKKWDGVMDEIFKEQCYEITTISIDKKIKDKIQNNQHCLSMGDYIRSSIFLEIMEKHFRRSLKNE